MATRKQNDSIMNAVSILRALSNSKRLLILCRLGEEEVSVGKLAEYAGLSPSAMSQHLAKLKENGFVKARRVEQTIYYSLGSDPNIRNITSVLKKLYCNKKS